MNDDLAFFRGFAFALPASIALWVVIWKVGEAVIWLWHLLH